MPLINIENKDANIENIVKLCNLNQESLFIDLGANEGQQVVYLDENSIESIAFEPHPVIFEKLKKSVKNLNNKTALYNNAAWVKDETMNLFFKKNPIEVNGGSSLIFEKTNVVKTHAYSVEAIDFSKFLKNLNRNVDILKIDIEGSEYHVIEHLIINNTIDYCKNLFVEDHERKIEKNTQFYKEYIEKRSYVHAFFKNSQINYYNWK
jgi:FkbM family methyltransferase